MVESTATLRDYLMQVAGVDILDATGKNFKSTYQIMSELAQVWGQLDGLQKSGILDKIAGKRGSVAVSSALQNWNIAEQARDFALNGSGSMDQQLEVYNQSIQASLDKFHVAFQELSADLINSDLIKGIVDVGTTFIKIIDELVKHIGVLGTALTGLGIAKFFSTAINGAKSVDVAVDSVELLSQALQSAQAGGGGFGGMLKGLSGILGNFGAKASGASSALSGMFSGLGSVLTNPLTLGVGAIAAGFTLYKLHQKSQEDLYKQASSATDHWNKSQEQITDYSQKYAELNEQLNQANLTESERIGIKQQLLDLQNEIVNKYGDQVSGIDLVNGKLETQLGIISQISAKEAERNLQDNASAYRQSVEQMTKKRSYSIKGGTVGSGVEQFTLSDNLNQQMIQLFKDAGFDQSGTGFKFTGDASQFDVAAREVLSGLEEIKKSAKGFDSEIVQGVIDSAQTALNKNNEILSKYKENYTSYLQQDLYRNGFGDELVNYAQLTNDYNNALLGGEEEAVISAKQALDEYQSKVDEILGEHPEYGDFFNEIADSVDKTTEAIFNFKDIIDDGVAESTNGLKEYEKDIYRMVNNIKKLELDGVDVQDILLNGGAGYADLSELAKLFNPDFDFKDEGQLKAFADMLTKLGVVSGETGEEIDLAKSEFDDFLKKASASIDTIDKVNAALVNSFKSGGLSARIDAETGALTGDVETILSAYKDELGDGDIDQIFERTANGIIVNRDALRALQAQQENTTKAEFIERIKEAQYNLANSNTEEEKQYWQDRLNNVKLLASAYDGATSAYQKWVNAQNMGEAGDQYDTIVSTALKRGEELYDKGLVGTNEFRAIAQLYSDQDLALASVDELTEAYENGVGTVKKYFTEGQEGAVAFADKMVELGVATKEGDFYNFEDGIDTAQIADELDISVDLVEAAFKKLGDYGFDIHFMTDDQLAEFDTLTEKAEEAQNKLKELRDSGKNVGDTKLLDIDLSEIDTIDEMKSAIAELEKAKASPEIDPASAEAYEALIDSLQQKLDLLSETDIGNEVNFTNLDSAYNLLGSLQGRMTAIDNLNATSTVDIDVEGDDQVQLVAEQIANLPPEIKKAVGFEVDDDATKVIEKLQNKEVQIPVSYQQPTNAPTTNSTATVDVTYNTGDLPTIAPQTIHLDYEPNPITANVVAKLDNTEVENYKPKDHNPTVKYSKDSSEPDSYQPSDKYASVNYTVSVLNKQAVDNLPDDEDRYITYHIKTEGTPPGKYKGTVPQSTFNVMFGSSHARGTAHANGLNGITLKRDENALINELGAEIVVRPSEDSWMIFNDGKPTMGAPLKKGDLVFSADQTKELLEKGWTDDFARIIGNSHARGTVNGTAHARKVTGSGSFKKQTTTSNGKSNNNGGGGNGSGNGNGSGGNDKANKEAKEFLETLDEIEIKIDRVERKIKNLDTNASNVFYSRNKRENSLKNELTSVEDELDIQRKGKKRYEKKANSVKLSESWKKKVREGKINIEDVKDEKVWDKIQEYQKWWNSRHSIHLTAGKPRRHINYNAMMKYA